jgi:hypothetical protein
VAAFAVAPGLDTSTAREPRPVALDDARGPALVAVRFLADGFRDLGPLQVNLSPLAYGTARHEAEMGKERPIPRRKD